MKRHATLSLVLGAIALMVVACLKQERRVDTFTMCDCVPSSFCYAKRVTTDTSTVWNYYANTQTVVNVVGSFGANSPHIYDLDASGTVNTPDLFNIVGGYGATGTTNPCDFIITDVFSHGWLAEYPEAWASFTHQTVLDDPPLGLDACPLDTWWSERIYLDSVVVEYWHKSEPLELTEDIIVKLDSIAPKAGELLRSLK